MHTDSHRPALVRDVIGDLVSSPHATREVIGTPDMRNATITGVRIVGDEIRVETTGGSHGPTFSVFVVADADLRERVARALEPGLGVYVAAESAL